MKRYSNGILLPSILTSKDIAEAIYTLLSLPLHERDEIGRSSKSIWEMRFNAKKNARCFADEIGRISEERIKQIVVITRGFPYGNETSFILSEIEELIKHYDLILIAEASRQLIEDNRKEKERIERHLQDIIEESEEKHTLNVMCTSDAGLKRNYVPRMIFCFARPEILNEVRKAEKKRLRVYMSALVYYSKAVTFLKWFKENYRSKSDMSDVVFYTYWQLYPAFGLCLGHETYPGVNLITRAHGCDLYDERDLFCHRLPFRDLMDQSMRSFFFISNTGREYYLSRNHIAHNAEKYKVSYLGSREPNKLYVSEMNNQSPKVFRIVSCSNLIPLKRVDRIIDALKNASDMLSNDSMGVSEIEWVHFGEGVLGDRLRKYAQARLGEIKNVSYLFMGQIDNDEIHRYYSTHKVDCFISTSSTEGLPVSIMEAMSYGIPIIATDVGGVKEAFL